jgi:hypothetical protein
MSILAAAVDKVIADLTTEEWAEHQRRVAETIRTWLEPS